MTTAINIAMQAFYNSSTDTLYIVPNRNGSAFFTELTKMIPLVEIKGAISTRPIQFIEENFKNTPNIITLYRNPIAKYMSAFALYDEDFNKKIGTHSLIPDYSFNDYHFLPTMHIQHLISLCFPEKTKFIHLTDLNEHLIEEYPLFSQENWRSLIDVRRGEIRENEIPVNGQMIFDRLAEHDIHFNSNTPGYNFFKWLSTDIMSFEYIKNNLNLKSEDAFLLSIEQDPLCILRSNMHYYTYSDALNYLDGTVREELQSLYKVIDTNIRIYTQ